MPKLILGLISQQCGGKGTGVRIIQEECPGTPSFRFSTALREFLHRTNTLVPFKGAPKLQREAYGTVLRDVYGDDVIDRGQLIYSDALYRFQRRMEWLDFPLAESRKNLQRISTNVRQIFGEDTLARRLVRDVLAADTPVVNVEGIRRRADMAALREAKELVTVFISAAEEDRWKWSVIRNENEGDAEMTYPEFRRAGRQEAEREIAALEHDADVVLCNDKSKEEFVHTLRTLVRNLCKTHGVTANDFSAASCR